MLKRFRKESGVVVFRVSIRFLEGVSKVINRNKHSRRGVFLFGATLLDWVAYGKPKGKQTIGLLPLSFKAIPATLLFVDFRQKAEGSHTPTLWVYFETTCYGVGENGP